MGVTRSMFSELVERVQLRESQADSEPRYFNTNIRVTYYEYNRLQAPKAG